jgi:hypothetical protein
MVKPRQEFGFDFDFDFCLTGTKMIKQKTDQA